MQKKKERKELYLKSVSLAHLNQYLDENKPKSDRDKGLTSGEKRGDGFGDMMKRRMVWHRSNLASRRRENLTRGKKKKAQVIVLREGKKVNQ